MRSLIISFLLAVLFPSLASAEQISCKVVGISDGDTLTCLASGNKQIKVRLAEIDAPESKQPYGAQSKRILSDLVFGKLVVLSIQDTDRYGRTVARVQSAGVDVNYELVARGAAWAYTKYLKDQKLQDAQTLAGNMEKGLWALPDSSRVAPWDWRAGERTASAPKAEPTRTSSFPKLGNATGDGGFSCSTIKHCSQMSGCAEAMHQLRVCRNPQIDGDRDGVPCEAICR
ncbi:Endonuclease YncB, thermonuclease family [Pseudomonas guineae]|uniref:Endonuclease YncB, thermonuclease family n=1 Tax=Pseudomonas guineae TaxID=425504 RepID=A0A1I3KCN1_9PSED|nr:thermonuclease family protein [Pseudomonas guineae]SFI70276.1 Endonuclease YncB, thermonuclease family [Pseudomonas guineae]